ncbi:hypothetical protein C8Q75DRAFT_15510 [Abortiporus biennis]|nr:hypothetical protein C8Q75DRAFT_15510 [Abortiporus biennis]
MARQNNNQSKASSSKAKPSASQNRVANKVTVELDEVVFPQLTPKYGLQCTPFNEELQDQILIIQNLFNPEECKQFIKLIESLPLEITPPAKRGEADRVNHRLRINSSQFAQSLFTILSPHLPQFPPPPNLRSRQEVSPRSAHSLNSNIRLYKYTTGQYFGPHYDDSVKDPLTGAKSEWTILVYLSGVEDGVIGGETLFYEEHKGKRTATITPPLNRGSALLHRHGHACMLHEGSPVTNGTKYILRSDLMFMNK